jgi:hypothetical protein
VFQLFWSFLPEAADAMEAAGAFIRDLAVDRERGMRMDVDTGASIR